MGRFPTTTLLETACERVARALHAPLDVFIVRKLGVPGHEELAMGALASGGVKVLNPQVVQGLGIPLSAIDRVAQVLDQLERMGSGLADPYHSPAAPVPPMRTEFRAELDARVAVGHPSGDGAPDQLVMRKLHQTIRKVSEDIPRLSYNTAVAAMMEYINVVRKGERTPHHDEVLPLITLVAPFAPHMAEELWEQTGGSGSVFDSAWPSFDPITGWCS